MHLDRTHALLPRIEWREASPSTNVELRDLARVAVSDGSPLPHGTLLATDQQTAGRGRLERGWVTPKGQALAVSVLVRGFGADAGDATGRPDWGELGPAWLPLIAGSAVTAGLRPLYRATDSHEALRVGTKWPNDVHVRDEDDAIAGRPGKKLCGILCELLPDGSAVFGMGLNLLIPEWELPTDRATSLLASGAEVGGAESFSDEAGADLADRVIEGIASELLRLTKLAAVNPQAIRSLVARNSLTLGTEVRAHLPGGKLVDGHARALAADGSLIIDLPTGGSLEVSAGDIEHLR